MFITIEGGEGAGKSTLIRGLSAHFEGQSKKVVVTREPGGTSLGEQIRDLLLHSSQRISPVAELQLFLASRAQHLEEVILPAVARGEVVLCDRFNDSSVAYQGHARGLGADQVRTQCSLACMGHEPELTFYLDISPDRGLDRLTEERDRIESEGLTFHERVRAGFLEIARKNPERVVVLDATRPAEEVLANAIAALSKRPAAV